MVLLKEELNISISELRIRSLENFAEIKKRSEQNQFMDSIFKKSNIDSFRVKIDIKRDSIESAKSNLELLEICSNKKLTFNQSHHFDTLLGELRTENLELNKLYKLKILEEMFFRATESVSYDQESQEIKCP